VEHYGPAFLHLFNVTEAELLDSWTVEKFRRYQRYAHARIKDGGNDGV